MRAPIVRVEARFFEPGALGSHAPNLGEQFLGLLLVGGAHRLDGVGLGKQAGQPGQSRGAPLAQDIGMDTMLGYRLEQRFRFL